VFSPNGDGINDEFRGFPGCEISNYEQNVYDRWGNLVFYNTIPDAGWNGEIEGNKMVQGVFAYRIEFDYMDNGKTLHQVRLGTITLLR
jgi:gliding motility-associated-like protein